MSLLFGTVTIVRMHIGNVFLAPATLFFRLVSDFFARPFSQPPSPDPHCALPIRPLNYTSLHDSQRQQSSCGTADIVPPALKHEALKPALPQAPPSSPTSTSSQVVPPRPSLIKRGRSRSLGAPLSKAPSPASLFQRQQQDPSRRRSLSASYVYPSLCASKISLAGPLLSATDHDGTTNPLLYFDMPSPLIPKRRRRRRRQRNKKGKGKAKNMPEDHSHPPRVRIISGGVRLSYSKNRNV